MNFEYNILMFIKEHFTNPFMNEFMPFISNLDTFGAIWILLCITLLATKRTRHIGIFLAISLILDYLIGNLALKNLVNRTRPYLTYNIPIIVRAPFESSFPSGHALSSFTAAFAIYKFNKNWGISAIFLAILIAFSRVYLFVHYPSDILASFFLAFFVIFLTNKLYNKYYLENLVLNEVKDPIYKNK